MNVLPMGPLAVLVEGLDDPAGWALGLRALELAGVVDVVPAAQTVLVSCASADALAAARAVLGTVAPVAAAAGGATVTIPVQYSGADLAEVADLVGWSVDAVVAAHAGASYVAAFSGFSPGWAYLRGLPPALHLPRRATPRTRVPAGSVAIASEYTGVYPRESPGGWHLLGTTDVVLFDPAGDPPALIQPGTRVRFRPA